MAPRYFPFRSLPYIGGVKAWWKPKIKPTIPVEPPSYLNAFSAIDCRVGVTCPTVSTSYAIAPSNEEVRKLERSSPISDREGACISYAQQGRWFVSSAQIIGTAHQSGGVCEDSVGFAFGENGSLTLVVTDGVGSGARGDVCSRAVVNHVLNGSPEAMIDADRIHKLVQSSEDAVKRSLSHITNDPGASMLAAVWQTSEATALVSHVGDCRVYWWTVSRSGEVHLQAKTLDHTYSNLGESPPIGGRPDDPARMIGLGCLGAPDIAVVDTAAASRECAYFGWLLCSDGVHAFLPEAQIELELGRLFDESRPSMGSAKSASVVANQLLNLAVEAGSDDDITVLVAYSLGCGAIESAC